MLKRTEVSLPEALRSHLALGRPVDAIMDSYHAIEACALREPEALAAALDEAARLDLSRALSSLIPARALGVAIVTRDARILRADTTFTAWFEGDGPAFRRLVHLAAQSGSASGLIEARDGTVIAACAGAVTNAKRWPLPAESLATLEAGPGRFALLGFAPSRISDLAERASAAFGFTPLESRLAEALLYAPTLEVAADGVGVGRETARDAIRNAQRKSGARRTPDLIRQMLDMMCGERPDQTDLSGVLAAAFGLTPAEARAAAAMAVGLNTREASAGLNISEHTLRGHIKAVYAKSGVTGIKDLVRLAIEVGALDSMTRVGEAVAQADGVAGQLRLALARGGRRVAAWDYGPYSGAPVLVTHGTITGRTLPPAFVVALQRRGFRPIVPQRPGFGLTDPADGNYLSGAAEDMATLLDALRIKAVNLLVRDDGVATALAFVGLHPTRVLSSMLVTPRWPGSGVRNPDSLMGSITRAFLVRPEIVAMFGEMLRRQTSSELVEAMIRRSANHVPADVEVLSRPGVVTAMVRDIQAMAARTSRGFADEQGVYAAGWRPPKRDGSIPWLVAECGPLTLPGVETAFATLRRARFIEIEDGGLLLYHSHPQLVADLFAEHATRKSDAAP